MLINRIIGAFAFRKGVYAEVEKDRSFTIPAWILVVVAAFLNGLGAYLASTEWVAAAVVDVIFAVLGFAVGILFINLVGRAVFKADVSYGELVRTMGLAYVWRAIGVLGVLAVFAAALSDLVDIVQILASIMLIAAWLMAAREALDLGWVKTIVTVVVGWLAQFLITTFITALVLGLLGLAVGAL